MMRPAPDTVGVNEILTAGVGWIARSERDRADAHVTATVINVPAFFGSIGGAAAGELGHARLKRGKGGPAIAPRFSSCCNLERTACKFFIELTPFPPPSRRS